MEQYDVAVIGAGPAGSMAAKYAAMAGARTIILEEHKSIGWPVECAGLLGTKAMQEAELSTTRSVVRGLKGATVYSPGAASVSFKAASFKAWVVDRRLFDRSLALEAVRCGAELRLGSQVRKIRRFDNNKNYNNNHNTRIINDSTDNNSTGDNSTLVLGDGGRIEAKVVISAEGVRARLARKAGIGPVEQVLSGAQVEVPFKVNDHEKVEVHLGVPGLFAWVIPIGDDSARIGLCTKEAACNSLRSFLQRDVIRKRLLGSPVALVVGGLPLGPPKSTVADGILAVGDAAGQVKPTSGGGVYPGLVCAKIAGSVAADAALAGDCSAGRLREYDKRWREVLGRELAIGMRLNRLLNRVSCKDLDEVLDYLAGKPGLIRTIEEQGDIDRPSVLMARMLPKLGLDGLKLARLLRYVLG
jgi:digeranylgeranylglycerophospholipid reductase